MIYRVPVLRLVKKTKAIDIVLATGVLASVLSVAVVASSHRHQVARQCKAYNLFGLRACMAGLLLIGSRGTD